MKGHDTALVDVSDEVLAKSKLAITKSLGRIQEKFSQDPKYGYLEGAEVFMSSALKRLTLTTDMKAFVESADIVIESIVENIDAKKKLFAEVDKVAAPKCIFASNTSSLPIAEIASATNRKDRFGGLHFFNPVPVMRLLEVIKTDDTTEGTFNALMKFGTNLGKHCVTCKDTPGFIVNRLLVPYLGEAVHMAERGDATIADIDMAMKHGAAYPMGPFELADFVGLDVVKFILDGWNEKFPDVELFRTSPLLDRLVSEGKLGRKTGEGFYKYDK
ncbi:PREDICTED: hydroxyacyl-coenzyme A dehydrogenase, mitochondrial-like isoform X1 [Priapulus caudatus]|uniref:3-hydroxyacyl-CoA dehydrogenase n=1 Tax=Priapulus caudatus TaxID=37621 RepID=A0ABM1ETR9_PRICU|nr:PREDICTED: hydroxyacyl-coenzyme A dehydrogenase, mitochondrial-like isoform X1 [Priapulus caudatus]